MTDKKENRIVLSEDWAVTMDRNQWILEGRRVPTEGKNKGVPHYTPEGYYMRLSALMGFLFDQGVRTSEMSTLAELAAVIDRVKEEIVEMCDVIDSDVSAPC